MTIQSENHNVDKIIKDKALILFDGSCSFCHFWTKRIYTWDRRKKFYFSDLHSAIGKEIMRSRSIKADSIVLYSSPTIYIKSEAVIEISSLLGFPFSLMRVFEVFPKKWCDFIYDSVAQNRKRWFGEQTTCFIPDAEDLHRFL